MNSKHGDNYIALQILKTRVIEHDKGVSCASVILELVFIWCGLLTNSNAVQLIDMK